MKVRARKTHFLRGVLITAEKNIRIYYTKAPVLIFGLLFPFFMFLSFYLGRKIDLYLFIPGIIAMSLFFTSSSIGPMITPWEKQAGTFERLLSFPITINTIILGDVTAGMIFGLVINLILLSVVLAVFSYPVNFICLIPSLILASFCFSSLGVLLASPAASSPSNIMMLSSLIRFPLIFISGIFVPLGSLHSLGRAVTFISPITYLTDLINFSLKGESTLSPLVNFAALAGFSALFIFLSNRFHRRNLMRGL